ncbi:hypothetical protein NOF55_07100 [Rhizobiaceae bacterium BDR2-2]|uniref:Uncharacterized protein n=1 Tax=Ectorhizobium quercum TaxID=2965071 RepID=A0AAE3MXK4_9HYPH|nr:hypothetical protein [Ectorhizobium quercum]MCX8996868.1 hypothetical protein [Ectorhizobium quercum]
MEERTDVMSGLYVIASKKLQRHLVQRRQGYGEHEVGDGRFYVRENYCSRTLAQREDRRIRLLPPLIEDLRSVRDDLEATFFALDQRNRETIKEALVRGIGLPASRSAELWVLVDEDRRLASAF